LLIKTGFFHDKNSLHLEALDAWTRQRLPAFRLGWLANKESASTRSAISVPQGCWLIGTEFSVGTGRGYKNLGYLLLKAQRMAVTKTDFIVLQKIV